MGEDTLRRRANDVPGGDVDQRRGWHLDGSRNRPVNYISVQRQIDVNISSGSIAVASAMMFAYTASADIPTISTISDCVRPCRRSLSQSSSVKLCGLREHL